MSTTYDIKVLSEIQEEITYIDKDTIACEKD